MKKGWLFVSMVVMTVVSVLTYAVAFAADAVEIPADQFLTQVLDLVKGFGGLPWMGKVSGIILLVIASMKVSFLRPLWDKLGVLKTYLAPVLGVAAGILSLGLSGQPITLQAVCAYLFAGAGAVLLSELLEVVKAIPGIGSGYLAVINFVEGILGGAKKPA